MLYIGDTKAGVLVGSDRWGNKFYENMGEELPLRVSYFERTRTDHRAHEQKT